MQVICSKEEYENLQKEVCFIMNDLKQMTDMLCSKQYQNEYDFNANAAFSSQALCDKLKSCLVQINFIMYNKAREGVNYGDTNNNNFSDSSNINNGVDQVSEEIEQL